MARPLPDLSDAELRSALASEAEHVSYSYTAIIAEMNRRAALGQADASFRLSLVSIAIAIAAVVIAALK